MATDKTIKPELKAIGEYLKTGNAKLVVPEYQRAYQWSETQANKLLADIKDYIDQGAVDEYFFGTVISDNSETGELRLIDGQQRTTTFLLLVNALRIVIMEKLARLGDDAESRSIRDQFENRLKTIFAILYNWDEDDFREILDDPTLVARRPPRYENRSINENKVFLEDFAKIIHGLSADDIERNVYRIPRRTAFNTKYTNFYKNFRIFYNEFSQMESSVLNNFAKTFLGKCQVIQINSWNFEQAVAMFNSLNSDGLPLTDADIISAQLFANVDKENLGDFTARWEEIIDRTARLEREIGVDLTAVLAQLMYIDRATNFENKANMVVVGLRKFYSEGSAKTEEYTNPRLAKNPFAMVESIEKIIASWEKISEMPALKILLKFSNLALYFLATFMFNREFDAAKTRDFIDELLRLFALQQTTHQSFSSRAFKQFLLPENMKIVRADTDLAEISGDFRRNIQANFSRDDIRKQLIENTTQNNAFVWLNDYLYAAQQRTEFVIPRNTDVEHIMPQDAKNSENIRLDAEISADDFKIYINKLGNKMLLESSLNRKIGEAWFKSKQLDYAKSAFPLAQKLATFGEKWTASEIDAKTDIVTARICDFVFEG